MKDMQNDPVEEVPDLLADWISREQLEIGRAHV